ncbi:MAG: T9SS type A sorting domain-containing protein [Saprospiraceae bacterium]|nr:T9SS type A sorting domain-containing protein [Saprospiraceae bacterium]
MTTTRNIADRRTPAGNNVISQQKSKSMNYKIIFICLLISNLGYSQVNTVIDSLNNPVAMTFIKDEVFVVLHGSLPGEGKIVSFNVADPQASYQIHIDSLTYPRAIIEKDSILYIGLRDDIVMVDLRNENFQFDTIYHEQFLFPRSFTFDNNNLIFAQQGALSKIDLSKTIYEKEFLFFFENNPLSIATYLNSILIAEGKSIHKYDLNTNTISELLNNLNYATYSILIVGNNLYLDQSGLIFGTKEIVVFNLKDLDSGSTSYCDNLGNAIALNEYQGAIYFAEQKAVFNGMPEGKIRVIIKEPGNTLFSLNVFPNPTHDFINIEGNNQYKYVVYNSSGRKVQSETVMQKLNISSEPSGIYNLKIFDQFEHSLKTVKIVKQ